MRRRLPRSLEGIATLPILQGMSFNPAFDGWLALKRREVDVRIRQASARLVGEGRAGQDPETCVRLSAAAQVRYPGTRGLSDVALAVLPFDQIDQVGGEFFLAEGVTDELVSRLGKLEGIMLAGRTSVLAVAARGQTLTEMASGLRVTHLIEGEVRRTPEMITVRIALIEGATGAEVWADRIEGSIDDFFSNRAKSSAIMSSLRSAGYWAFRFRPAPMRRMTASREAYALYLQGRSLVRRSITDGAAAKSVELLEQALGIDPRFRRMLDRAGRCPCSQRGLYPVPRPGRTVAQGGGMRQAGSRALIRGRAMRWRSRGSTNGRAGTRQARSNWPMKLLPGSHRTPMSRCGWDRSCSTSGAPGMRCPSSRRAWSRILPTAETTRCSRPRISNLGQIEAALAAGATDGRSGDAGYVAGGVRGDARPARKRLPQPIMPSGC